MEGLSFMFFSISIWPMYLKRGLKDSLSSKCEEVAPPFELQPEDRTKVFPSRLKLKDPIETLDHFSMLKISRFQWLCSHSHVLC